jgi:HrpA-like RNA helicase
LRANIHAKRTFGIYDKLERATTQNSLDRQQKIAHPRHRQFDFLARVRGALFKNRTQRVIFISFPLAMSSPLKRKLDALDNGSAAAADVNVEQRSDLQQHKVGRLENDNSDAGKDASASRDEDEHDAQFIELQQKRRQLPIYEHKQRVIDAVKANQCVVVIAETGSGKTTQIAQFILEDNTIVGDRMIAVTQPRRVAAVSVARRVTQEIGPKLAKSVAYAVRFSDTSNRDTKLKFLTDGVLLGEILRDPELSAYACIVLDEAHERSISTDILFGLIRQLMTRRADLRVLVTSATLDAQKFSTFFSSCPVLNGA